MDVSLADEPVVVDDGGGSGEAGAESEGPEEGADVDESPVAGRGFKFAPHRVVHYHYRYRTSYAWS